MSSLFTLMLLQSDSTAGNIAGGAAATGIMLVWLAVIVLIVAALWKIFVKAGEPGWAAIVPIYNVLVMLKIAGKPMWWVVLMFIPFVNFIVAIIMMISFAQAFNKGTGFALGLVFLPFIFYPLLAWGDAGYNPRAVAAA